MIHLMNNYYMNADSNCGTVGTPQKKRGGQVWLSNAKYYTTLDRAVSATAELALRDKIASGDITTLNSAVVEFKNIKNELNAIISEKE